MVSRVPALTTPGGFRLFGVPWCPYSYISDLEYLLTCFRIGYVGVNSKRGLIGLRFALGLIEAGYFVGCQEIQTKRVLLTVLLLAWRSAVHEQLVQKSRVG
jgi:hypothetical protein